MIYKLVESPENYQMGLSTDTSRYIHETYEAVNPIKHIEDPAAPAPLQLIDASNHFLFPRSSQLGERQ